MRNINYYEKYRKYSDTEYLDEFIRFTSLGGKYLTTHGFNEISKISSIAIIKGLKKTWLELLEEHNLIKKLYDYVTTEFIEFAIKNRKGNMTKFKKTHPYIRIYLLDSIIDTKIIRERAGFIKGNYSGMYNDTLLRDEYLRVKKLINNIPTHTEFAQHSNILTSIYCDYYGIKGQRWDQVLLVLETKKDIVEKFIKERDIRYKEKSIQILKSIHVVKISLEELKIEFKNVFDNHIQEYNTHPTKRMFNETSKYNDITYRKRLKLKWSEIIKFYGYIVKERKIQEKMCLEIFKKVLNTNYIREKTWKWLKNKEGNYLFCDGYFPDYNLVVEFDGIHHRVPISNFGGEERYIKDKIHDNVKECLVKKMGLHFLRIDSRENWRNEDYIKGKLIEVGIMV